MRLLLPKSLIFLLFIFSFSCSHKENTTSTILLPKGEGEDGDARQRWLETMHRTAPGLSWRKIEHVNQRTLLQKHKYLRSSDCTLESFADGQVQGRWRELGSNNQSGSVFEAAYLPERDELFLLGAGGSLWHKARKGGQWNVINQDIRLEKGFLQFVKTISGDRLLAVSKGVPHYSDNHGQSWRTSSGFENADDALVKTPVFIAGDNPMIAVLYQRDTWAPVELKISTDQGSSYQTTHTFTDANELSNFALSTAAGKLFMCQKTENAFVRIYSYDQNWGRLQFINPGSDFSLKQAPANLIAAPAGDSTVLFAYRFDTGKSDLYRSRDEGKKWSRVGELPARPWELSISKVDSSTLFLGEVDAYYSFDQGEDWVKVNNWWEYYNDESQNLHADIMAFSEFRLDDTTYFQLVSTHGGLYYSEDQFQHVENISLEGLNVGQYYSTWTNPQNPLELYAGSQDQGVQYTALLPESGTADLAQLLTGDFGHVVPDTDEKGIWAVYPGGSVFYVKKEEGVFRQLGYDLESENESVWLPPLHTGPDGTVFLAGGNHKGGEGSYLIELYPEDNRIKARQSNVDFLSLTNRGGRLSAIEINERNPEYRYVATTNGRFFFTTDGGQNWEESASMRLYGNYLYGQAIVSPAQVPQHVYLGGSGYSNPPVFYSRDGGRSFVALSDGLPPTLVYDLAVTKDEEIVFAATEAGPYLYLAATGRWYDLYGGCTPNQTYWSVEWLEEQQLARFATFGRGIWDFSLETVTHTVNQDLVRKSDMTLFPNPVRDRLFVELAGESSSRGAVTFEVYQADGRRVKQGRLSGNGIEVSDLGVGMYVLRVQAGEVWMQKRFFKY